MSEQRMNYPARSRRGKRKNDNSSPPTRDINAANRVQIALKLKLEGQSWEEVAAGAGYGNRGTAHKAVMREFDRCISKDVEELRTIQLYMLSQLQARCYESAMDTSNQYFTFAVDRVITLSKRISEIMGLDIPVDQAVNMNQVIVREMPPGYLGIATVEHVQDGI